MELIDRYLQAVKFWLPKVHKQDIIAELSEDIQSRIEDKESALGRQLDHSEVGAILKQIGRPVMVANLYLPQQYLIGPGLFPIYKFVLKVVAFSYLVPSVLTWIGLMIFDRGYRTRFSGMDWMSVLGSFWQSFWLVGLLSFAVVTILFVVLERANAQTGFLERWDPNKLPAVRNPNKIQRSGSFIELVANLAFCSWWIATMRATIILDQPGIRITLAPVWRYFFWGFLALALVNSAVSGMNLIRPYWTRLRATFRLITDCTGIALFFWLCKVHLLMALSVQGVAAEKTLSITNAINAWMSTEALIVLGIGIVLAGFDVYRIMRVKAVGRQVARIVTAGGIPSSVLG